MILASPPEFHYAEIRQRHRILNLSLTGSVYFNRLSTPFMKIKMQRMLAAMALSVLTLQALPQTNNLTIEGRVLLKSTSQAVPNVLVLLGGAGDTSAVATTVPPGGNLAAQIQTLRARLAAQTASQLIDESVRGVLRAAGSSVTNARFAFTDNAGRFQFTNLAPGTYTVHAAREGFFGPKVHGAYQSSYVKTVELKPEDALVSLDVGLAEGGIIKGHVSGSRSIGNRTLVTAYRMRYVNGVEKWITELVTTTDLRNDFLLRWVAPGDVYVGAQGTFFKDVVQPDMATKIVVKEGETVAIDLNIQQAALNQPRRVSGIALNAYAPPNAVGVVDFSVLTFLVAPRNPSVVDEPYTRFTNSLAARDGRRVNGEFEIGPVLPGVYELISYYTEPTTRRTLVGRAPFQVTSSNVTAVSAPIRPGATLSGEFKVNGVGAENIGPGSFSLELESLGLVPTALVVEPNPIVIDASGKFTALNLPEERYRFHVGHLPPSSYVEDVRVAGRSVFDEGYELGAGTGEIQILIRTGGQFVGGTVRTADGIPREAATVVLVPPQERRMNPARYRTANSDSNGAFRMTDVPPGDYTVFAWENALPTAWMNSKFFEKYSKLGRSITVTAGAPLDLQLPMIPDTN